MLKKFVSLVVGVSLALATIGVAATSPTIATKSVYDASESILTVTTTVGNAVNGSTYTYLVYDNSVGEDSSELEASEIKYVDQKEADGTNLTFEFEVKTTDAGILFNDVIKVGGKTEGGDAYDVASDIITPGVTVGGSPVAATFGDYVSVAADDFVQISIADLGIVEGVSYTDIHSATQNVADTDYIVGYNSVWLKKSVIDAANSIAITVDNSQTAASRTLDIGYIAEDTHFGTEDTDVPKEAVIAVGQVQGDVLSYGIEFSATDAFTDTVKLQALGRGTRGMFAIKWRDFKSDPKFATAETIYIRTYYELSEDNYTYDIGVKSVAIPAAEVVEGE